MCLKCKLCNNACRGPTSTDEKSNCTKSCKDLGEMGN